MKKLILPLFLAAAFLFTGLNKAYAAVTLTITNNSAAQAASNAVFNAGGPVVVYSMQVNNSGGTNGTMTGISFTSTGSAPNSTTTSYSVYYETNFNGPGFNGTAVLAGTILAPTTGGASLNFATFSAANIPLQSGRNTYVFLVENVTIPNASGNIKFGYNGVTLAAGTVTPPATTAGTAYSWIAPTASITNNSATNAIAGPALTNTTNGVVYSMAVANAGTVASSLTGATFTSSGSAPNSTTTTYSVYYQTAAQGAAFNSGIATLAGSIAAPTTANASLVFTTFTTAIPLPAGNTYVFLVENITIPGTSGAIQFGYSSVTTTATVTAPATLQGTAYTWTPPTTVTLTSFNTPGVNGLAYDPITYSRPNSNPFIPNPAVYGFSLTGGASGSNASITSITLNNPTAGPNNNNNEVNNTITLWSSPTSTFNITTATQLSQVTVANGPPTTTFTPATAISVAPGSTSYYFVTYDAAYYTSGAYSNTEQDYLSSTGSTITPGTQTTGYLYTIGNPGNSNPTVTAANDATGLSPVSGSTIIQGTSGYALAGISLTTNRRTASLSNLTFAYTISGGGLFANYFGTPVLYSSTSATFNGTASAVAGAVATVGTSTISFDLPNNAPTFTTTPTYYYLVINYTNTAGTVPATVTFVPSSYTTSVYNDQPVTGLGYPVNTYTCTAPPPFAVTLTSLTTTAGNNGLSTSPVLFGNTNYSVYGFSLVGSGAVGSTTINSLTFNQNGTSTNFDNTYYTTAYLYSSTTNNYSTGTLSLVATTTSNASTAITFATSITATNTSTLYYFIVLSNTLGNSTANTFKLTYSTDTYTGTDITAAASVSGPAYTFAASPGTFTYYWWGNGATTDWHDVNNWTTSTGRTGVNLGTYPGAVPTDNAIFSASYWRSGSGTQNPTIGAYSVLFNGLTVADNNNNINVNLTVNSADSLTVSTLNIGAVSQTAFFNIYGTGAGVISSLRVTGTTNLNNTAVLSANTNGIINFPSGSSFNFVGTNNSYGELYVNGGRVNTDGTNFSYSPTTNADAGITVVNAGTASFNGGTHTLNGFEPEIQVSGGTANFNNATINVTGSTNNTIISGLIVSGGTCNINGTSASPSTINLGTTTANGVNSEIYTSGGLFNLGQYSTLNILTTNSSGTKYNFYNGGGVTTIASTATINPTSTTAYIFNGSNQNYFTLLSDANGSATIGKFGTGAKMTGTYNVQRYISTASRNYRLLSSPTNTVAYTPGTAAAPNLIGLYYLGQTATIPTTTPVSYPGAFVGGPAGTTGGFTAATGGPCLYLYQESILPNPANYNSSFYTGKNVAVTGITRSGSAPLYNTYLSTTSTVVASGGSGTTPSDNGTGNIAVPPGNGYLLYYIGNNANTPSSALNATAVTNQGYINQGTIPVVMWGAAGSTTTALTKNSGAPGAPAYPGLTMVGNPYPSSIDLQQVYTDNTTASSIFTSGVNGFFNTLDPSTEQFSTYGYNGSSVTTSGTNPQRYVASGQGFYVTVVNAGKTLTFYEDQKTSTNPTTVLESIPVTNPLAAVDHIATGNNKMTDALALPAATTNNSVGNHKISTDALALNATNTASALNSKITSMNASVSEPAATNIAPAVTVNKTITPIAGLHLKFVVDSLHTDEAGVYFTPNGSDKYDANDALDIDGPSGKVYLSSYTADNKRTSINSLGNYTGGKQAKLFVKSSTAGIFQLQLSDIANIDTANYSVFLLDKFKADSLDLTLYKSYNFNYAPGTANDSTRFVLAIEHKPVPYYALLSFAGQKVTPGVQLNWQTKNLGNKTTFVLQKLTAGNVYVAIDSLQSAASGEFSYVDQHPTLGNNTYRLEQINALGAITYSAPVTIGYNSTNPNGGLVLYPNPAKTTMTVTLTTSTVATQVATADIYNAQGKLVEHKVVNSNSFTHDVSGYELGVYIMQLKNSNGDLVGNSKFVKVN